MPAQRVIDTFEFNEVLAQNLTVFTLPSPDRHLCLRVGVYRGRPQRQRFLLPAPPRYDAAPWPNLYLKADLDLDDENKPKEKYESPKTFSGIDFDLNAIHYPVAARENHSIWGAQRLKSSAFWLRNPIASSLKSSLTTVVFPPSNCNST